MSRTEFFLFIAPFAMYALIACVPTYAFFHVGLMRDSRTIRSWYKVITTMLHKSIYVFLFLLALLLAVLCICILLLAAFLAGIKFNVSPTLTLTEYVFQALKYFLCAFIPVSLFYAILYIAMKFTVGKKRDLLSLEYEPYGTLARWGSITRNFNKKMHWIEVVSKQLIDAKVFRLDEGEKFIFISPSANIGDYEKHLGLAIKKANPEFEVEVVASDQAAVENHEKNSVGEIRYCYEERVKAQDLQSMLAGKGISSVNCIWDIKGYMWYNKKRAEEIFKEYAAMLEPKGVIIIDAYPKKILKAAWNEFLLHTVRHVFGYAESSTYAKIRDLIQHSSFVADTFHKIEVGDGIYRMHVYMKKASEEAKPIVA